MVWRRIVACGLDGEMRDEKGVAAASFPVVVIGASAGGLEALIELVDRIDPASRTAYVIVQHLAPNQRSVLHELLQTHCRVPVSQIEQDEAIEGGRVFVVPPGQVAEVTRGTLHLDPRAADRSMFRPIDATFKSLARSQGRNAYCVVLSGTGSDGASGLRTVKEAGGITFAQESESARFPGMPDAAAATGLVDFILPAAQIVPRLEEIIAHRRSIDDESLRERMRARITEVLPRITAALRSRLGHDFSDYKPGTMLRRIERRMILMRLDDADRFADLVENDEDTATLIGQEFLIGVTEFFRDPEAFDALRKMVVAPILDRDEDAVRIWVPGCSTGEEVYSLAMLFFEAMEERGLSRPLQIFGTDIDGHALTAARAGYFTASAMDGVDGPRRERFFELAEGQFRAGPELRECCVFAPHNVVQDPPFSRLDLISCRNLLIYLSADLQRRVLPRFHFSLKPSGFLFLGPSEGLSGDEALFTMIEKTHRLFRRDDAAAPSYSSLQDPVRRPGGTSPPVRPAVAPGETQAVVSLEAVAERTFLRNFAAPFAVVSRSGEVRYLSQAMTGFARPSQGIPSSQIDTFLATELRVPVRTALGRADEAGKASSVEGVLVEMGDGRPQMFDVTVSPIQKGGDDFLLVLSEVRPTDVASIQNAVTSREAADRSILETENVNLRRQLKETLQEFDTSSQELKSSNEELMSMNEELQSSNEELETSREELQSINEELETVNAELRENNRQLLRANSDLKNLFESTDVAVLFLDPSFTVRNYTPATAGLYGIKPRDIGRPIMDLSARIDYPQLKQDAERVEATLQPIDREVRIEETDETFLLRMKPYRTTDNRIDGFVLSFVDITGRKRNEEALERQRQDLARQYAELENLYDTTPVGLSLIDQDLRYVRINKMLSEINGIPIEDHIGKSFEELLPETADVLAAQYREVFETGQPKLGASVDTVLPKAPGVVRSFVVDLFPVFLHGVVVNVGTCVREVTEQRRLMHQVAESEARMKRLFDAAPVFIAVTEGPDQVYTYSNPYHDTFLGRDDLVGKPMLDAVPELRGQGVFERFDAVYRSGERQVVPEFRAEIDRLGDGVLEEGWFSQVLEPVYGADGSVSGVVSFAYEVTNQVAGRKAAEASEKQKTLLLAELQHRVKNTLATVRAISRFLVNGAADAHAFHDRLSDRLQAMSRTHDLLTDADWTEATLGSLVEAEAAPYEKGGSRRVRVSGGDVRLDSREALAFGMALHELMTNAAKYGALSNETGSVEVEIASRDGRRSMTWREVGGPPIADPDPKRGFGTVVLEKVLAADVRAKIEICYEPGGLFFEADF
jgi:two-component system CheB/CheR fusion protein